MQTLQPSSRTANASRLASATGLCDDDLMVEALEEARRAAAADEVPIGCVIVDEAGRIIGRGHNRTRELRMPTAHAEMLALEDAFRTSGSARLLGARVFSTLEPCFMCAGALVHARVERVVWSLRDPKFGACASLGHVLSDKRLNHQIEIHEGAGAEASRQLLQQFFRSKRDRR